MLVRTFMSGQIRSRHAVVPHSGEWTSGALQREKVWEQVAVRVRSRATSRMVICCALSYAICVFARGGAAQIFILLA